ncbi:hypothetical protein CEUSTIGMA_g6101.t1 [Chlamydomonas eustigma]|uniref:SAM domain-containing protein n=1 Tax=Chlamydomonas eustigma TaxID=1157962 RepID=A0A250X6F5_9CHLO|nr:hypothetical protein CEUSTIGMA_g6101.t1 [Chlamydomonas eustigma]|eukprot:GAX78663.1 hypothetical protein CEUSTIGMA_g6101.t1 [Chlamydomonas eustigma]
MTFFKNQSELALFLTRLGPHYLQYSRKLWTLGVRTAQELANATPITLKRAGVLSDLHIDNIRATALALHNAAIAPLPTADGKSIDAASPVPSKPHPAPAQPPLCHKASVTTAPPLHNTTNDGSQIERPSLPSLQEAKHEECAEVESASIPSTSMQNQDETEIDETRADNLEIEPSLLSVPGASQGLIKPDVPTTPAEPEPENQVTASVGKSYAAKEVGGKEEDPAPFVHKTPSSETQLTVDVKPESDCIRAVEKDLSKDAHCVSMTLSVTESAEAGDGEAAITVAITPVHHTSQIEMDNRVSTSGETVLRDGISGPKASAEGDEVGSDAHVTANGTIASKATRVDLSNVKPGTAGAPSSLSAGVKGPVAAAAAAGVTTGTKRPAAAVTGAGNPTKTAQNGVLDSSKKSRVMRGEGTAKGLWMPRGPAGASMRPAMNSRMPPNVSPMGSPVVPFVRPVPPPPPLAKPVGMNGLGPYKSTSPRTMHVQPPTPYRNAMPQQQPVLTHPATAQMLSMRQQSGMQYSSPPQQYHQKGGVPAGIQPPPPPPATAMHQPVNNSGYYQQSYQSPAPPHPAATTPTQPAIQAVHYSQQQQYSAAAGQVAGAASSTYPSTAAQQSANSAAWAAYSAGYQQQQQHAWQQPGGYGSSGGGFSYHDL